MRPALRLLAPSTAALRTALPRSFAALPHSSFHRSQFSASRFFATAAHAGAVFDSAVNDLPYADFLRVPESDVLLDARHTKWQVDACVRGLKEYGVTPGSTVALLLVPSSEFTLLQLAAIKLGATVVCIDPCAGASTLAQVLSKHSVAALFVSLDAPTTGASAADTLKTVLPELQAKRIVEGKRVTYKAFPGLKFVAHVGDETQPHGVLRVRDMMWGESIGDKGAPAAAPLNPQAPCLVFVDSKGAVTSSIGHDAVSSALTAWLKRSDTSAESKTFGPHGVAGDSAGFFKAFYGGK